MYDPSDRKRKSHERQCDERARKRSNEGARERERSAKREK